MLQHHWHSSRVCGVFNQQMRPSRTGMQPGELCDMKPESFKAAGRGEHTSSEMDEVIQWESHTRHVGVDGELRDTKLVLLRVIRSPSHRINRPGRRHQTGQQAVDQRMEKHTNLWRHHQGIAGSRSGRITGEQLMHVGGATPPMTNHNDGIGRKSKGPQLTTNQQRLEPCQWFHDQSAHGHHQSG